MKASLALLTSLLAVAALHSEANDGPTGSPDTPCCYSFTSKRIPLAIVESYYNTGTHCPSPAVVFLTKRGRHICARPGDDWVTKLREQFERRQKSGIKKFVKA